MTDCKNVSLNKLKEVFSFYDKENKDKVKINQFGRVLRSCGQCPNTKEIQSFEEKLNK